MQSHQPKIGILVLTDYPRNLQNAGHRQLHRQIIRFDDILWITTDDAKINYVRIVANDSREGLLNISMNGILDELPPYFVRISNAYIVNITHDDFKGLINSSILVAGGKRLSISHTYRETVRRVLEAFYIM